MVSFFDEKSIYLAIKCRVCISSSQKRHLFNKSNFFRNLGSAFLPSLTCKKAITK